MPVGELVLARKAGRIFGQGEQFAEILLHRLRHPGPEVAFQLIDSRVVLASLRFEVPDLSVVRLACLLQLPDTCLLGQPVLSDCLLEGGSGCLLGPRVPDLATHKPGQGTRRGRREVLPHRDQQRLTEFAWVKRHRYCRPFQLAERQLRRSR